MSDNVLRIDAAVNKQITAYRQRVNALRLEIGDLEISKYRLLGEMAQIEGVAQALLKAEAERMDIPEGEIWSVASDGTVTRDPEK